MGVDAGFRTFVTEQLAVIGPVQVRSMFGGAGIFLDGMMFALIADDVLYFKADERTRAPFEAEGLQPFTYETKSGRRSIMAYWQAPERLFEDPDAMRAWAGMALQVAREAAVRGSPKRRKTRRQPRGPE